MKKSNPFFTVRIKPELRTFIDKMRAELGFSTNRELFEYAMQKIGFKTKEK